MADEIMVNRAPVLTLWGVVVAQRLGFDRNAALSLGKCLAGLNAQSKGRSLGIYGPPKGMKGRVRKKPGLGEELRVELCGRPLPAVRTKEGVRAVVKDKPIEPESAERYLEAKFGDELESVRKAMSLLARSISAEELKEQAYPLYEKFRPEIPRGAAGWGAKGKLDLRLIRSLAH
jgi:hypothetical protein